MQRDYIRFVLSVFSGWPRHVGSKGVLWNFFAAHPKL